MMGMGIPLSSLRRDEVYTFLGGLYVALAWSIYVTLLNSIQNQQSLPFQLPLHFYSSGYLR